MTMSLRASAAVGVRWSGAAAAGVTALHFIQLAVLTRFLEPEDFGLMAMVAVVMGIATAVGDGGLSSAIIQREEPTRRELSALYWANIFLGIAMVVAIIAASPLVVSFYGDPRLYPLLIASSLIFGITPVSQQFQVLLEKELEFATTSRVRVVGAVSAALFAIASAAIGFGVMSLVIGQLAGSVARGILLWRAGYRRWKPGFYFRWSELQGYWQFGAFHVGQRVLNYVGSNIDYIIIGKVLGPEILGFYSIAYQLVLYPVTLVNPILTKVAFPVFARRQRDNHALCLGYVEMTRLIAFLIFPMLVGLAAVAPVLVPLLFGPGWEATVGVIQILVIVGMLRAVGNPVGSILLAKGRSDIGFAWSIGSLLSNAIAFWVVAPGGLQAVAWAFVALSVFRFFAMRWMLWKLIGLSWLQYIKVLLLPVSGSLVVGAGVLALMQVLSRYLGDELLLGAGIVLGVASYVMVWMVGDRKYIAGLIGLLVPRVRREAPGSA